MSEKNLLPCIHVAEGDIPPRVLVCGDPQRAERISQRLEGARCLARNREYWTYVGKHKGVDVAVVSHGVGCGGAAIAFESLWRAGAKVIIRTGTCGGMQPDVTAGSLVVATAACREEGGTEKILSTYWYDGAIVNDYGVYFNRGRTLYVLPHATGKTEKLYTASNEALFRTGAMASRISQLNIIDILYTALNNLSFDASLDQLSKTYIQKPNAEDSPEVQKTPRGSHGKKGVKTSG